jgi:hypothetical protein
MNGHNIKNVRHEANGTSMIPLRLWGWEGICERTELMSFKQTVTAKKLYGGKNELTKRYNHGTNLIKDEKDALLCKFPQHFKYAE